MRKMSKTQIMVENALKISQQARNSDKELLLQVWKLKGLYLNVEQEKLFRDLPSPEAIGRMRRKLQEDGKYLATPQVAEKREQKSINFKYGDIYDQY